MQFSREMYSKVALIKAAYNFTDSAYVHLDADERNYYVELREKSPDRPVSEDSFINEMLAQSVRHEVYLQTKNIRELLLARAVASSVLPDEMQMTDELPATFSEDEILRDWFSSDAEAGNE